ncbi:Tetratricopeptide TPR_1 repeat-containing protein [Thalassoporum mexicanum PCC 7367]|uniref:tetratricopeptide repeat protein n=1 Tax=Thalassoporum mexicanum TaxID=3457544 RepID=UPI00029FC10E|nr:tetratricopeptide repeat protein [Pseudanabaena sp. PCC 7367]AFY70375.1 Tetratricopeptide TPR_1 repeat-containing protein [Pseudanabaena sp. PCC 7367]
MKKLLLVAIVAWFVFVGVVFMQADLGFSDAQETEIRKLIWDEIGNSNLVGNQLRMEIEQSLSTEQTLEIQKIARNEIDRQFSFTLNLLNGLIATLVAIPIIIAGATFFLQKIIRNQLVLSIKKEVEPDIEKEVKEQLASLVKAELDKQIGGFANSLEELKSKAFSQFEEFRKSLEEKDQAIAKLSELTPPPGASKKEQENVSPEVKQQIQENRGKIELILKNNPSLLLTANDHIQLGVSLYFEGKLEEAIDSYDKAIEIKPNYAVLYYDRGGLYSLQGNVIKAIQDLKKAIELDSTHLNMVKTDKDFDNIRDDDRFKALIQSFEEKQEPEGNQD